MISLGAVIKQVESSNNYGAMRFELSVFDKLNKRKIVPTFLVGAKVKNKCSYQTALMICATSWGAWQLMGFNIYKVCEFPGTIRDFLCDPSEQDRCAELFLQSRGFSSATDFATISKDELAKFASIYNGPSNVDAYTKRLTEEYTNLVGKL